MCRILIFGGTTEGRELAEFCVGNKIHSYVSVATEYGENLLCRSEFLHILVGRKDKGAITRFVADHGIRLVLDATHPYAVEAGKNISEACEECSVGYVRILRENSDFDEYGRYFDDMDSLIQYLNTSPSGNVLITTGSKNLKMFCRIKNYAERCIVRVLPDDEIMQRCEGLGFNQTSIIAEKGPFSEKQNIEHLKKYDAKYLVTKESGNAGGFTDKASASKKCGAELLIIKRPVEIGISLDEAEKILLAEKFNE